MNKRIIASFWMAALAVAAWAQSGTNSPYSQYGVGILSDQSQGFTRGMSGVGIGMRMGNQVNTLNPASYSSIDSLTMIFDVGLSGQITNFKEGGSSVNARNADFEYAVGSFRLVPNVGVAFGVLPYSNVGYHYTTSTYLDRTNGTISETNTGSGGLHQAFVGIGFRLMRPLSVGVNMSYLWGSIDRSVTSSSTTYINSLVKTYSLKVNSYKFDVGVQWEQPIGKANTLTVGATVGLGHQLGADPTCQIINVGSVTSNRDTTSMSVNNGLSLPMTYAAGVAWKMGNKLMAGADVTLQQWGSEDFPAYDGATGSYTLKSGLLKDRYKVNAGVDYVPNFMSRNYLRRVHYRVGAAYATPYYKINGQDGPKELSVSAGLGLPLQNAYNNRSILNVSAQWGRQSAPGLITENTFRINLGITFNERWFMKWKLE